MLVYIIAAAHVLSSVVAQGECMVAVTGMTTFFEKFSPVAVRIAKPRGISPDGFGGLYVADTDNNAIRRVLRNGMVVTVAGGNSVSGYGGDGGPATAANLSTPYAVVANANGTLWIADTGNHAIRRVSADGIITTIAGGRGVGYTGNGGAAVLATLSSPQALAVDAAGTTLFIADTGNHAIRRISPAGIITSIAGGTGTGYTGDGLQATAAKLASPKGVALDRNGVLWIADSDNHAIRSVSTTGIINTAAGGNGGDRKSVV